MISTAVWGDGAIARAAVRAIDANPALELTAVISADPDRIGRDAGELAGLGKSLGVTVTADAATALASGVRAVVYAGSGRTRSVDARADVVAALRAGAVVVAPSTYPLHDHRNAKTVVHEEIRDAVGRGGGALYIGDVDSDWVGSVLPFALRGIDGGAESIRVTEIVDYSGYDLPGSVRFLMGMGEPLTFLPPMLAPRMPSMVWGDRVRVLARALGVELDEIRENVERVELEVGVETPTMGKFDAGGMGAVRMEICGLAGGRERVVIEHVGRIAADLAPHWPQPPAGGVGFRLVAEGDPRVEVTIEPGRRTGDEVAVERLVGMIESLSSP